MTDLYRVVSTNDLYNALAIQVS